MMGSSFIGLRKRAGVRLGADGSADYRHLIVRHGKVAG